MYTDFVEKQPTNRLSPNQKIQKLQVIIKNIVKNVWWIKKNAYLSSVLINNDCLTN